MFESLESKEHLDRLSPQSSFIAPEAIERAVVEIGEAEEAIGQFPRCAEWIFGESLELMAFGIFRTIIV